jgi:hypothetical protein
MQGDTRVRQPSARTADLLQRMQAFFDRHIDPNEARHHEEMAAFRSAGNTWQVSPLIEEHKPLAREAGLSTPGTCSCRTRTAARLASPTWTMRRCAS